MTAEKTLNITEVPSNNLIRFLIDKQAEGFEVVGAEQTATSQTFTSFQFPRKCVLLLG